MTRVADAHRNTAISLLYSPICTRPQLCDYVHSSTPTWIASLVARCDGPGVVSFAPTDVQKPVYAVF